jgi:hypothetical protein
MYCNGDALYQLCLKQYIRNELYACLGIQNGVTYLIYKFTKSVGGPVIGLIIFYYV